MGMPWSEHRRSDSAVPTAPFVSLRPTGIAFSAGFVVKAALAAATRVRLLLDDERLMLGFRFHKRESDADAYALNRDGGTHRLLVRSSARSSTSNISG